MSASERAVCARCGADKAAYDVVCAGCGHRPEGDGLLLAWLVSTHHLDDAELDAAAARIRRGQPLRPSAAGLDAARRALGAHPAADPGLPWPLLLAAFVAGVAATSAVGWATWAWWRHERPRTARQTLLASLAGAAAFFAASWWR